MNELQQKTRAKYVELFNNENSMEAECIESSNNSNNSDTSSETKVIMVKLPTKK